MAQASCVDARRSRIAVVDDDRNIALLLVYNLQAAGHDVSVIVTGEGAVDALFRTDPDLIILDWELPGLSGIEVLRRLHKRFAPRHIPVIMLTGRSDRDDRERAIGMGADVFMPKPFAMAELLNHVDTLLLRELASSDASSANESIKSFVCHH
jgi:two-component system phosphate regulon response regulator PhoB